jgi:Tol biopolymer transport system component
MQVDGNESNLSIIDLKTGESTVLCLGGVDPSWSTQPDGPIAFVRGAEKGKREFATEEVWLVNPDGGNLRRLATGGFPSWTPDGRLFFRSVGADKSHQLQLVTPARPDVPAQQFPLQGGYPAMSRDGQLVVMNPPGQLQIQRPGTDKPQMAISLDLGERGLSDFSPDGRYVAYGSWDRSFVGVLLIEVASGKTRLLANLAGTLPRWSPDGRFIAVDERAANEIVILDVSSLDLNSIFERTPAPPTPNVQAPSASAAP